MIGLPGRAIHAPPNVDRATRGGRMANSKSKHIRVKTSRRQRWKARKKRQKAATKAAAKK